VGPIMIPSSLNSARKRKVGQMEEEATTICEKAESVLSADWLHWVVHKSYSYLLKMKPDRRHHHGESSIATLTKDVLAICDDVCIDENTPLTARGRKEKGVSLRINNPLYWSDVLTRLRQRVVDNVWCLMYLRSQGVHVKLLSRGPVFGGSWIHNEDISWTVDPDALFAKSPAYNASPDLCAKSDKRTLQPGSFRVSFAKGDLQLVWKIDGACCYTSTTMPIQQLAVSWARSVTCARAMILNLPSVLVSIVTDYIV
jgi:hypothetical protein